MFVIDANVRANVSIDELKFMIWVRHSKVTSHKLNKANNKAKHHESVFIFVSAVSLLRLMLANVHIQCCATDVWALNLRRLLRKFSRGAFIPSQTLNRDHQDTHMNVKMRNVPIILRPSLTANSS